MMDDPGTTELIREQFNFLLVSCYYDIELRILKIVHLYRNYTKKF